MAITEALNECSRITQKFLILLSSYRYISYLAMFYPLHSVTTYINNRQKGRKETKKKVQILNLQGPRTDFIYNKIKYMR